MHGNARVVEFDFGEHPFSRPAAAYLQKHFPGRLEVHWGSSLDSVPAVARGLPTDTGDAIKEGKKIPMCDVLIVDGGHDWRIALADVANMRALSPTLNGTSPAWTTLCAPRNFALVQPWLSTQ